MRRSVRWMFFLVSLGCFGVCPGDASAEGGLSESNLQLINEAVTKIQSVALHMPKSERVLTRDIIDAYARRSDPYADYLSAQEYAAYLEAGNGDYFGVQMELVQREGRILMYPFVGGVADRGGVMPGDELVAINGSPVYGKSIFLAGAQIRGAENEVVGLIIRSGQDIPRTISLRREATSYSPVSMIDAGDVRYIRIARFTSDTDQHLMPLLQEVMPDARLVIDLRRNHGGSLRSAARCADLFLPDQSILYYVKQRGKVEVRTAIGPQLATNEVVLIQDGTTASAAEVFISALTINNRAVSVGAQSFGKGQAQRFITLSDGSAMLLTFAELLTAGKEPYHERGLIPGRNLPQHLLQADFTRGDSLNELLLYMEGTDHKPMEEP